MTYSQHTPGPWAMSGTTLLHVTGAPANIQVAMVTECRPSDARLMTAAPELLEASRNALNVLAALATGDLKNIHKDSNAIALLRAAIAKATGV